ncbi:MAG TPA: serine hydrolase domain-containing protein [bacterium]|nr:serine hydrolase domain-containing protein [bacterium]HPO07719.1 serine hydrolase domain-containing protein [bacterium]HQO34943.1 serine hydrolase domain-containing protein [bacterium]HQP99419.1 serine hydrolase domain-containing protein [bacterium]
MNSFPNTQVCAASSILGDRPAYRHFRCERLLFLPIFLLLFCGVSTSSVWSEEWGDISATLDRVVQQHHLPAMVGAVILDGRLYATGIAGVRKAGTDVKATIDDPFHLGSCTKSMTCTLLAILIEQGKLRWDSTLAEIFPEFVETMNPTFRTVTVEMLMMMSSGLLRDVLPSGLTIDDIIIHPELFVFPGSNIVEQRYNYVGVALQSEPVYQPGQDYLYSNAGYIVLGAIAEKIEGKSWEDLMQEMIFRPLGMTSAGVGTYGSTDVVDAPWWHYIDDENNQRTPVAPTSENDLPNVYGPAGLVHCSITDWSKYILVHLNGEWEDQILLKQETIVRLHTAKFPGPFSYACGWVAEWGDDRTYLFHDGSNGMNLSNAWLSPQNRFAVIAVTNQAGDAASEGMDQVIQALIEEFAPRSAVADWEELR